MNKIYFFAFIAVFLLSCQKEDSSGNEIPDWFKSQIEQLEKSGTCFDCSITKIVYKQEIYYHLYCRIWSCMYCNLYNSNGNLVKWDQEKFSDFIKNKREEAVIWKCKA